MRKITKVEHEIFRKKKISTLEEKLNALLLLNAKVESRWLKYDISGVKKALWRHKARLERIR